MYKLLEPEQIAENIMQRCKLQKTSARKLCLELHIGVNTVYDIKNRGSYPRIDTLFKIASGLGCTVEELCTLKEGAETKHIFLDTEN